MEAVLEPQQYYSLMTYLLGPGRLYLEYTAYNEVKKLKSSGYDPHALVQADPRLKRIMDFISSGELNPLEPEQFESLVRLLTHDGDNYCLIQDLPDYIRAMTDMAHTYRQPALWNQMSLANICGMGPFSADEAVKNYARKVWKLKGI